MAQRLDVYLFNNNLAESREKAKALIMSGIVFVDAVVTDDGFSGFFPVLVILDAL